MNRLCLLFVMAVSISACGLAARMEARNDMEGSKAAYNSCLVQNPQQVSACEALRLSYEADLKAFEATAGAMVSGRGP
jgi:hypothetical protein